MSLYAKGLCRDCQVNGVRAAWSPRVRVVCLQSHLHGASFIALKIPLIKCLDMMEVKSAIGLIDPALIVPRKIITRHGPVSSRGASLWDHLHWWGGYLHCGFGGPPNKADDDPPRSCPVCRYSKVAVFNHRAFLFGDSETGPTSSWEIARPWLSLAVLAQGTGLRRHTEALSGFDESFRRSWGTVSWVLLVFQKLYYYNIISSHH